MPAGETWFGTPARTRHEFLRGQVALYRLAKIVGKLEDLVKSKSGVSSSEQ